MATELLTRAMPVMAPAGASEGPLTIVVVLTTTIRHQAISRLRGLPSGTQTLDGRALGPLALLLVSSVQRTRLRPLLTDHLYPISIRIVLQLPCEFRSQAICFHILVHFARSNPIASNTAPLRG